MSSPSPPSSDPYAQPNSDNAAPATSGGPATSAGWLVVFGIIAIATVIFAVFRSLQPPTSDAIGKPAPRLDLIPLTGDAPPIPPAEPQPVQTAEADSFQGVTLLHFWGTWCSPCRMEYPELVEMVQEFSSVPGFRFVSVSSEPSVGHSSIETLKQQTEDYYESIGIDVPTYCDPTGRTRQATAAVLGNPGLYYPSTLLIDRQGKIAGVWEGFTPSGVQQMREALAAES